MLTFPDFSTSKLPPRSASKAFDGVWQPAFRQMTFLEAERSFFVEVRETKKIQSAPVMKCCFFPNGLLWNRNDLNVEF